MTRNRQHTAGYSSLSWIEGALDKMAVVLSEPILELLAVEELVADEEEFPGIELAMADELDNILLASLSRACARPRDVFLLHFYMVYRYPLFRSGLCYVERV